MRLDPRSPAMPGYYDALAIAYFSMKKYREAADEADHAYEADTSNPDGLFYSAAANALLGNMDVARTKLEDARKLDPKRSIGEMRKSVRAKEPNGVDLANRYIDGLQKAGLP